MNSLNVPCILVDNQNLAQWWSYIIQSLSASDFISIDLELSGIGSNEVYGSQVDERYKSIKEVATSRSILSMGIACFRIDSNRGHFRNAMSQIDRHVQDLISDCLDEESGGQCETNPDDDDDDYHVCVNVFNFLTLCNDEFTIDTRSMKFLVQQGFDFNELSLKGIPYYRGNNNLLDDDTPSIRKLLLEIIAFKIPIVFHNGLLDLAFLYQNFYCQLPAKLDTFVSDLAEMFPNGIFDTKFIAFSYGSNTYLEYLFNYSQRNNYFRKLKNNSSIRIKFDQVESERTSDVKYFDLSARIMQMSSKANKICDNYAKYGWCNRMDMCENSHNIDLILDEELKSKKDSKSKNLVSYLRQQQNDCHESPEQCSGSETAIIPFRKHGCHHSGNDAFMTGYYFLYYTILKSQNKMGKDFRKCFQNLAKFRNKIFLTGKLNPLNIMKSSYVTNSKQHRERMVKIVDLRKNHTSVVEK